LTCVCLQDCQRTNWVSLSDNMIFNVKENLTRKWHQGGLTQLGVPHINHWSAETSACENWNITRTVQEFAGATNAGRKNWQLVYLLKGDHNIWNSSEEILGIQNTISSEEIIIFQPPQKSYVWSNLRKGDDTNRSKDAKTQHFFNRQTTFKLHWPTARPISQKQYCHTHSSHSFSLAYCSSKGTTTHLWWAIVQIQAHEHQGPATLLSISSLYKTLSQAPQALQTFVSHFVTAGLHSLIHSNFHRAFDHVLQLRMFPDLQFFWLGSSIYGKLISSFKWSLHSLHKHILHQIYPSPLENTGLPLQQSCLWQGGEYYS